MKRSVHIVASAARTPVGLTAESSVAAVRAGISRVDTHPFMVDIMGDPLRCARDGRLDPGVLGTERICALAKAALIESIAKLTRQQSYRSDVSVLLALPEARPGFSALAAKAVKEELSAEMFTRIAGIKMQCVGEGHAGAIQAIERGVEQIIKGDTDVCIVGGVDSYFEADTLLWLDAQLRIAREQTRNGFYPGEACAAIVLANNNTRQALGLPSLARLDTVCCTLEKRDPDVNPGLLGEALTEAIRKVAGAQIEHEGYIADVYCDINGERPRATDWGFALLRIGSWFRDGTDYRTAVGSCGDVGAATAALNVVLAAQAWQRGYASGNRSLVWGASWQGLRGAVVLEQGKG